MDRAIGYILFLRHLVSGAYKNKLKTRERIYEPRGTAARGIGVGLSSVPFHPRQYCK
jgi:hypothetical protein